MPKLLQKLHWDEDAGGTREARFEHLLEQQSVPLVDLTHLSWSGVSESHRPKVWAVLLRYHPCDRSAVAKVTERRRSQYRQLTAELVDCASTCTDSTEKLTSIQHILGIEKNLSAPESRETHLSMVKQILLDAERTCAGIPFVRTRFAQDAIRRLLICWSFVSPSGYLQGIGDLVIPFLIIHTVAELNTPRGAFVSIRSLSEFVQSGEESLSADLQKLPSTALLRIEADTFWCLANFLCVSEFLCSSDHANVQKELKRMQRIVQFVNFPLYAHLSDCGVRTSDFAFRWLRCLLVRELPLPSCIRLWDTYIAEGGDFVVLHTFVCASLICSFADTLLGMPSAEEILLFLKALPKAMMDEAWTDSLIRQSFINCHMFANKVK